MKLTTAFAAAGVAVAAMTFALGTASAQQKVVLKASDVHPEGYPTVAAVESMGKKLEKATNGRLSVQMFPSMQLGGEKEAIEQAQVGAIALARVSVGALGPVVDDLNVFNLPYVFRNTAHMQHVIDGPIGQELLDKVTEQRQGPRRPRLDGRRCAQFLRHQEADQESGRSRRARRSASWATRCSSKWRTRWAPTACRSATTRCSRRCRPASSTAPRTIRRASSSTITIRSPSTTRSTST